VEAISIDSFTVTKFIKEQNWNSWKTLLKNEMRKRNFNF